MRVELLYADGDPAAMRARQNLVEVLTEDAFETPIQMIAIASADDAARLATEAADLAASLEAPWWRLRALEIAAAPPAEIAAIAAQLGISGGRGSSREPVRPRGG